MGQRNFQYQFGRVIKVVRIVTIGRDHQWQYVPFAALALPAQLGADLMDGGAMGLDIKQMWFGIENQHKASGQAVAYIKVTCVKINGDTLGLGFICKYINVGMGMWTMDWLKPWIAVCPNRSAVTSATVFVFVFIDSFVVCSVFAYLKRDLLQRVIEL